MRKGCHLVGVFLVAFLLPFSAAIGGADSAANGLSNDSVDGNRTRIVKRSKYLDTIKDALVTDKLKKIPVAQKLRKGFSGMRDPTRPTQGTVFGSVGSEKAGGKGKQIKVSSSSFSLTSTIVSPGRRAAIINGKTVTKGDKINGAVILGIFPASVKIKKNNKVSFLDMSSRVIKKPSR